MTAVALLVFVAAYVLIATERIHRVAAALWGAAAMVLIGAATARTAFYDEQTGVDWNVIGLLLGMMIIVSVVKQTGAFEYIAIWSAKRARGRPFRIMATFVLITAGASALLDNVTTVLLVAPVTLLVCERLDVSPTSFLMAEAMASNIGGTATLVGDPPNIIIAGRSGLSFNDFLVNLAPIVVVLVAMFLGLCWLFWGRSLECDPQKAAAVAALDEREVIRDHRLLAWCGVVLTAVVALFLTHDRIGLEPSLVALLGAGALVAVSRTEPAEFLEEVEWSTLVFFMGLFVMVGALVHLGVMADAARWFARSVDPGSFAATTGLLTSSAVVSGLVDNIPFVAALAPVVHDLAADSHSGQVLWWVLALGADLGGNATAVGASANVVVIGIAARNGHPISFWTFTKYGLVVTATTIAVSWAYVWLRFFAL